MEINEYLIKLFRTIKDMENIDLFPEASKLSRTEFRLIREIVIEGERGKDIISSELARRLGVTRSAVSQIVTKLEKEGIVQRVGAPDDRKIAYVRLSKRSRRIFQAQCRQANEIMDRVVGKLGEEKMKLLIQTYDEFSEALAAAHEQARAQTNVGTKRKTEKKGAKDHAETDKHHEGL